MKRVKRKTLATGLTALLVILVTLTIFMIIGAISVATMKNWVAADRFAVSLILFLGGTVTTGLAVIVQVKRGKVTFPHNYKMHRKMHRREQARY